MLKLRSIWHGGIVVVAALLLLSSVAIEHGQLREASAQGASCGPLTSPHAYIDEPGEFDEIQGPTPIEVYVNPFINGNPVNVDEVRLYANAGGNNTFIGHANPTTSGSNLWIASWAPSAAEVGPVELTAKILQMGTVVCTTHPFDVDVQVDSGGSTNVTGEFILTRIDPLVSNWVGVTGIPKEFRVEARFRPDGANSFSNVSSDALFNWRLVGENPVGFLDPNRSDKRVDYFTGQTPGEATLIVDADFMGYMESKAFSITVESQATTNYPELEDDEVDEFIEEIEEEQEDDNLPTEEQINSEDLNEVLTSDIELTSCLTDVVGERDYERLVEGDRRLSFGELERAYRCFTSTRFLLPANVAPIEPAKIREVREDNKAAKVEAVEQAEDVGLDRDGIVLSGTSAPNSTIVLYIFSEPLVLTTTTDENGNWTYVLEDPLEPGEHEVFVAVEEAGGDIVRSSAFTFNVAQAASIDTNPDGLSLTLDLSDPTQNSTIYYISAVVAVMLVGLSLYVFVIRRKGDFMGFDEANSDTKDTS